MSVPKRSAPNGDASLPDNKRLKSDPQDMPLLPFASSSTSSSLFLPHTAESESRAGLQRAMALALKHVGFESATPEAMEEFTACTEAYMASFIEQVTNLAYSARREKPTPVDFESTLHTFNLTPFALRPHIRPPIPRRLRSPAYTDPYENTPNEQDDFVDLPLLSQELSGRPDKDCKAFIPRAFPDFPSKHTYRHTAPEQLDPKNAPRIREDAAKEAKQGEDALRKLVRAAKLRKQKEVKLVAERDPRSRGRYKLWEAAMKTFLADEGGDDGSADIADHSMIVNSDVPLLRKEASRTGKRGLGI